MESDSIDGQSVASVSDEHSSVDGGVELGRKRKYNKGVQAEITKHGPLTLFIIIGMLGGLWQVQFGNAYGDMWDEFEDGRMRVFGVVLGRWEFIHVADCKPDDDWSVLRKSAKALSRMQIVGYLKYNIIDRIELNHHFETASMSARLLIRRLSDLIAMTSMPNGAVRGNAPLKETLTKWNLEHGVPKICNSVLCNSLAHSATTEDRQKFDFLNHIPYLLCRLNQPSRGSRTDALRNGMQNLETSTNQCPVNLWTQMERFAQMLT